MGSNAYNSEDLGKLLSAKYHYKYKTNNGQLIIIDVGEEYILIKKSNEDWWQVIKAGMAINHRSGQRCFCLSKAFFSLEKSQKSQGARSGEYRGW